MKRDNLLKKEYIQLLKDYEKNQINLPQEDFKNSIVKTMSVL